MRYKKLLLSIVLSIILLGASAHFLLESMGKKIIILGIAELRLPKGYLYLDVKGSKDYFKAEQLATTENVDALKASFNTIVSNDNQTQFFFQFQDIGYVDDKNVNVNQEKALEFINKAYRNIENQPKRSAAETSAPQTTESRKPQTTKRSELGPLEASQSVEWENNKLFVIAGTHASIDSWFIYPTYYPDKHIMEWATIIHTPETNEDYITYQAVVLGRHGVMVIGITSQENAQKVSEDIRKLKVILTKFEFKDGEKYSQFQRGDEVYKKDLAGLLSND